MCLIVILAYPLKLPIQTLLSVAPTRSVFWRTTQFQQTSTPQVISLKMRVRYRIPIVFLECARLAEIWTIFS